MRRRVIRTGRGSMAILTERSRSHRVPVTIHRSADTVHLVAAVAEGTADLVTVSINGLGSGKVYVRRDTVCGVELGTGIDRAVAVYQVLVKAEELILDPASVTGSTVALHIRGLPEVVAVEETAAGNHRYGNVAEPAGTEFCVVVGHVALGALLVETIGKSAGNRDIRTTVGKDRHVTAQVGVQAVIDIGHVSCVTCGTVRRIGNGFPVSYVRCGTGINCVIPAVAIGAVIEAAVSRAGEIIRILREGSVINPNHFLRQHGLNGAPSAFSF